MKKKILLAYLVIAFLMVVWIAFEIINGQIGYVWQISKELMILQLKCLKAAWIPYALFFAACVLFIFYDKEGES